MTYIVYIWIEKRIYYIQVLWVIFHTFKMLGMLYECDKNFVPLYFDMNISISMSYLLKGRENIREKWYNGLISDSYIKVFAYIYNTRGLLLY